MERGFLVGKRAAGKRRKPCLKAKRPAPLAGCKLPQDLIANILSRLPVKTLLRFRSVCLPWKTLIGTPKFISLHLSSAAAPATLLLQSADGPTAENKLSRFSLQPSLSSSRAAVDNPFPYFYFEMDVVGTHNGVVCLSRPPWAESILIFNPATKHYKPIFPVNNPHPNTTHHEMISVGFGFDPLTDTYKVVGIHSAVQGSKFQSQLHVYNCDLGFWTKKTNTKSPTIRSLNTKCEVVVNGVPYWLATIEDDHDKGSRRSCLLWFDVHDELLHHILTPMPIEEAGGRHRLVDWKGNIAVLDQGGKGSKSVDVWVIENGGVDQWKKKLTVCPIAGMESVVGCVLNGQIVVQDSQGSLLLYDPQTGGSQNFGVDGQERYGEEKFAVFDFKESLVSFKGEEPMTKLLSDMWEHRIKNDSGGKMKRWSNGCHELVFRWGVLGRPGRHSD